MWNVDQIHPIMMPARGRTVNKAMDCCMGSSSCWLKSTRRCGRSSTMSTTTSTACTKTRRLRPRPLVVVQLLLLAFYFHILVLLMNPTSTVAVTFSRGAGDMDGIGRYTTISGSETARMVDLYDVATIPLCAMITKTATTKRRPQQKCSSLLVSLLSLGSPLSHLHSKQQKVQLIGALSPRTSRVPSLSLSSSDGADQQDKSEYEKIVLSFNQRGMGIALATSCLTVLGSKCALPAVLSLLMAPTTGLTFPSHIAPQIAMSRLLVASTLSITAGKLLLGPIIDFYGGILSLQVALVTLSVLFASIAFLGQSFTVFAMAWIMVDFLFSSCWASCINALHQTFPPSAWPNQITLLASAARTGNAAAFSLFAFVLHYFTVNTGGMDIMFRQPWRPVFAISAFVQIIPLTLLAYFSSQLQKQNSLHGANKSTSRSNGWNQSKQNLQTSLTILQREARTWDFWLHLISRSVLMVYASFLLFVPTLMKSVYHVSSAFSARVGSLYALGCLFAVSVVARQYTRIDQSRPSLSSSGTVVAIKTRQKQQMWLIALLGTATFSSFAQLAFMMGWWGLSATHQYAAYISATLMFLWGFSFAIPFYLPPSLYALSRGGGNTGTSTAISGAISGQPSNSTTPSASSASATIVDAFDSCAFALLAVFNGYVAAIDHSSPQAWVPTFFITTLCALVSMISLLFTTR